VNALSVPDERQAYWDAKATLQTLYDYRCALYAARQAGAIPPTPPALTAAELVNAYGVSMNQYGQRYITFGEWHTYQQTPQPPRRFVVMDGSRTI
jgi:hypothetical protein